MLHCDQSIAWLLSICLEVHDENKAIFHYRGYWEGQKIKKISVRSPVCPLWIEGALYLMKIKIIRFHKEDASLEVLAIDQQFIDQEQLKWEDY